MGVGVGARAASSAAMTAVIVSNGQSHVSDQQMSYNDHGANIMFIIFLCVLAIVLVLTILRLYVSYLIGRRRRQQATTNLLPVSGQTPTTGLDPVAIAALPTSAYRRAGEAAPADCAVCLTAVEDGEVVRVLPNCRHVFHVGCIDMWLHSHSTCPLCRADAVAKEAGEASASKSTPELFSGSVSLGPALDGTSGTECGSSRCGGLGSSFRRMLSWELPGRTRRVQVDGVVDLERQQ